LKLIQLNAWGGRLENQIGNFLKGEEPDILCLQESISFNAAGGSGLFITTENIQYQNKLPYEVFAPVFSFNYMSGKAKFGNGIFSHLPIANSKVVFTHLEHKDNFTWSEEVPNMRNFVHAEIDINGLKCHVITHHGYWIHEHKNGNEETLKQMDQISKYIEKLEGPIILTGDFNLAPSSKSLETLNKMLINLPVKHKLVTTRTSLTHKTEVCDYIFVNDKISVNEFSASDEIVSDHKALILDFGLL
jgi:endonuclease/exonuclease/phosphatase family metal-dependent hydrolase